MKVRRASGVVALLSVVAMLAGGERASAEILVDDFSDFAEPSVYPIVADNWPAAESLVEAPVASAIGGLRFHFVAASPTSPADVGMPSLTVSADVVNDRVIATANDDSVIGQYVLLWFDAESENGQSLDLDVTGETGILINYSATADSQVIINLGNATAEGEPTAGNETTVALSATTAGALYVPFFDIDEPEVVFDPGTGTSTPLPPMDLSSLDSILLQFGNTAPGSTLSVDRISFIPEPASLSLAAAGGAFALMLSSRRRRRA